MNRFWGTVLSAAFAAVVVFSPAGGLTSLHDDAGVMSTFSLLGAILLGAALFHLEETASARTNLGLAFIGAVVALLSRWVGYLPLVQDLSWIVAFCGLAAGVLSWVWSAVHPIIDH